MPIGAARLGFMKQPPAPPTNDFLNPGFEEGLVHWNFITDRIYLNGGSTILGYPTPNDPGTTPVDNYGNPSTGDALSPNFSYISTYEISTSVPINGGINALKMTNYINGTAGSYIYGPAVYSDGRVIAEVGDTVSFWWRAVSSLDINLSDAYKIFAYLVDSTNGKTVVLLSEWSSSGGIDTGWQQFTKTIQAGEEGNYHFVFINGSWDSTFGNIIGAEFYIDNVALIKA